MQNNKKESGQGLIEYASIAMMVGLAVILILNLTGANVQEVFCRVSRGLGGSNCRCSFNFEDGSDLSDWEGEHSEDFIIENGEACIVGNGKNARTFLNSCAAEFGTDDFKLTVSDITIDSGAGNDNEGFDIWFRAQDDQNGYHFTYNSKTNVIRFWKRVDGKWIQLATKKVSSEWATQEIDFEIVVEGDNFTALKDGEVVLQASDSTFQEGKVGLRNKPSSKTCIGDLSVDAYP